MNNPVVINSNGIESKSMDYEYLLKRGIEYIQQLSGDTWTDYNYHDPGITILEQMCYALTDLGYRTNFSIVDILLNKKDEFKLEQNNLFYGPNQVFPSSSLTLEDIRKLLLERVENIRNLWVSEVTDSKYGFIGLYDILVQANEEANSLEIEAIGRDIKRELNANRALCSDLNQIRILKRDLISIEARVNIDSFVLGENVLAEIYHKIEKVFNPNVEFLDLDEILEKGYSLAEVYSGTNPKFGFIEPNSLKDKTTEIYISEIQEIIENVEGVIEIEEIIIYKNGVRLFEDLISFGEETYPFLEKYIHNYNQTSDKIVFFRNQKPYEIDTVILSQLYDSLSISNKQIYKKKVIFPDTLDIGSFTKEEIEEYFSIQNELPSLYKLKKNEVGKKTDHKTLAQVKQLKAYLYLFEQILANYLSQLANIRNFFSIDSTANNTYFSQLPNDIDDLTSVLNSNNSKKHLNFINVSLETKSEFLERKNKVLDHLLSRFSEAFDINILSKLMHSQYDNLSSEEVGFKLLELKKSYANKIVELGRNKIKAFNYLQNHWDTSNISGLESRIKQLLGVQNLKINSLVTPLLDSFNNHKSDNLFNWKTRRLRVLNGPEIDVIGLTQSDYAKSNAFFYSDSYDDFRILFLEAHKKKNYRILEIEKSKENTFCLLLNSNKGLMPLLVYESPDRSSCEELLIKICDRFKTLNVQCEGLFILEHILLRPTVLSEYEIEFYDESKNVILKSFKSGSVESLSNYKEDIYVVASNKNNYLVEPIPNSDLFEIVVYDVLQKPKYKSTLKYESLKAASKAIKQICRYFEDCRSQNIIVDNISNIKIEENNLNDFPSNFNYSNFLSVILPSWPNRFQNDEFKSYLNSLLNQFLPAHISSSIFYLDVEEMAQFEELYMNWTFALTEQNEVQKDQLSLQLIQLFNSFND